MQDINYWAVLVSALVSIVIGSIWYGPLLGKQFMKACDMDKWSKERQAAEKKKMGQSYLIQVIASFVMFYVLAHVLGAFETSTAAQGAEGAFWLWLGFVVPVQIGNTIWGGKWSMFLITAGGHLVTLLVVGAIIGAWH